jgi:endogenous inhibitor of DNA gyrase (YacG/DUF329 family)
MSVIKDQKAIVKWNGGNRVYYESKGYIYTKQNETFEVDIEHLKVGSSAIVKIKCDHCEEIVETNTRKLKSLEVNFCSTECANTYRRGKGTPRLERIKVNCNYCEKTIERKESYLKDRKNVFCGKKCADNFMRGKPNLALDKKEKVNCYTCNSEFKLPPHRIMGSERHFCSRKCHSLWQTTDEYSKIHRKDGTYIEVECDNCGEFFSKMKSQADKHKYNFCSRKCLGESNHMWIENPNPKKEKVKVDCDHCGEEKYVHEAIVKNNKYHFCGRECYSNWRRENTRGENNATYSRVDTQCSQCNKDIKVIPYNMKNRKDNFCSQECYWKYRSIHYSGENHPHFGKKKTPEQIEEMRKRMVQMYADGVFDRKTSIQEDIDWILTKLEIDYENEYSCKYYSIDNFLNKYNLMIEVMGDYWHSSPIKYNSFDDLNKTQKDGVRRDKSKHTYIKKYRDIEVLYLWEYDIRNNIELCEALIIEYIVRKGIMKNYHSFNYYLDENGLELKDDITLPFFLIERTG